MSPWWLDVGWLGGGRARGRDQRGNFRIIIFTGLPMWMKTLDTRHRRPPEGPVAESVSIGTSAGKLAAAGGGTWVGDRPLKSWVERSPSPNDARRTPKLRGTKWEKGSTSSDSFPVNPRRFHRMRSPKPSCSGGGAMALSVANDRYGGANDRARRFQSHGGSGLARRGADAERDQPPAVGLSSRPHPRLPSARGLEPRHGCRRSPRNLDKRQLGRVVGRSRSAVSAAIASLSSGSDFTRSVIFSIA